MQADKVVHELSTERLADVEPSATAFLAAIEAGETDGISCWRSESSERRDGSEIEGIGLFATQDIPINTLIAIKQGHVVNRTTIKDNAEPINGSHQQIGPSQFLAGITKEEADKNLVGYNHSCDPNARVVLVPGVNLAFLVSRKGIQAGSEITTDYSVSQMSDTHRMFICRCGSDECRGVIQPGWDWQDPDFQARYQGEFPDYEQQEIDEYNALTPERKQARERTFDGVLRLADMIALSKREVDIIEVPLAEALDQGPPLLRPIVRKIFFNNMTRAGRHLRDIHEAHDRAVNYFAVLCPFGNIDDAGVDRQHPEAMSSEQREVVVEFALQLDRHFN
jgi:hypothetical protein